MLFSQLVQEWSNLSSSFRAATCSQAGEGNDNPLQYSCLENPTDRGGWQATVHGVAKSQTWLSDLHTHTHTHTHTCSQEKPCVPCGSLLTLQPSASGLMAHTHPPSANDCSLCTLRRRHGLTRIVGIFALKIVSESSVQRRQLLFETELISHGFQFLQMLDILSFR